jgi:hypothetical protein
MPGNCAVGGGAGRADSERRGRNKEAKDKLLHFSDPPSGSTYSVPLINSNNSLGLYKVGTAI